MDSRHPDSDGCIFVGATLCGRPSEGGHTGAPLQPSMSAWIPALHAGMTKLTASALAERDAFGALFEGAHDGHEEV